jgi:polysaccharide chain length determinant protein (PEP-CTERM system associated)
MDQHNLGFNDIITIAKRRKWYIIIPFFAVFSLATITAFLIPPKYRASSTILIEDQEIPKEYVSANVTSYADQRLQSINQKIIGTTRLLEMINRFNLYADIRRTKPIEEVVAKMRKDIKFNTINADVKDPRSGQAAQATIAFSVSYDGKSPAVVQQITNELSSLYLSENLQVRQKQSTGTARFMEDEMKSVQTELAAVDSRISDFKQRNLNTLPELNQLNLQTLDNLDRDVRQANEQLRSLREKEGYLQSELSSIPTDSANQDKTRLNEVRVRLVDLKSRLSDKHPDVIKARVEIAELTKQLRGSNRETPEGKPDNPSYINLQSQLASTRADIASVKRQLEDYTLKREGFRKRIEASPHVEEGYKAMISERNSLQVKNDDLSKKFMEARVANGLEKEQLGERFTLIDAARLPEKPISPNLPAILLIGFVLGIGSGCGAAALKEHSDGSVYSIDELVQMTRATVLGAVPEITTKIDRAKSRKRRRLILSTTLASMVSLLAVFHFLIMDLDVFWAKLMRKLVILTS